MANLKSLNKYLSLYTDIKIEQAWQQVKVWKYVLDLNWKYTSLTTYACAIINMLEWKQLTTVSCFYLQDLITMYLKEVAKAEWIDPTQYRWSADLITRYPSYWLLYNTVEGFKQHANAIANWTKPKEKIDFPLDFLIDTINDSIDKFVLSVKTTEEKKSDSTNIGYSKSIDDIM